MALPAPIGTWRVVWFGSSGPYYYDDGVDADDKELLYDGVAAPPQSAFVTDGQIDVASVPILDPNVLRLVDVGVIVGDVVGPGASTDHAVVRWDGATGKLLQDSLVIINDAGSIDIPTGQGYQVNSIQVVTDQQAAEADAAALTAITITAGANTINIAATDIKLATLVTEIDAIKDTLNSLLAKLRTHGLIA